MSSLSSIGVGTAYSSYATTWGARSLQQTGSLDEPTPMAQMSGSLDSDDDGPPATSEHYNVPQAGNETSSEIDVEGLLSMMGQSGEGDGAASDGEFTQALPPPEDVTSLVDSDGDGSISSAELSTLVGGYGGQLATLMSQLDTDGDGAVSVQELQMALAVPSDALASRQQADAFVQFALGQYQSIAGFDTATTSLLDIAA